MRVIVVPPFNPNVVQPAVAEFAAKRFGLYQLQNYRTVTAGYFDLRSCQYASSLSQALTRRSPIVFKHFVYVAKRAGV